MKKNIVLPKNNKTIISKVHIDKNEMKKVKIVLLKIRAKQTADYD